MRNHYDALQVLPTASDPVIRAAYRALSQRFHPDRNPGNRAQCEEAMKIINEAYAVLSDQARRQAYDRDLRQAEVCCGASRTESERDAATENTNPSDTRWSTRVRMGQDRKAIDIPLLLFAGLLSVIVLLAFLVALVVLIPSRAMDSLPPAMSNAALAVLAISTVPCTWFIYTRPWWRQARRGKESQGASARRVSLGSVAGSIVLSGWVVARQNLESIASDLSPLSLFTSIEGFGLLLGSLLLVTLASAAAATVVYLPLRGVLRGRFRHTWIAFALLFAGISVVGQDAANSHNQTLNQKNLSSGTTP